MRILLVLLALVIGFGVVGCGSSKTEDDGLKLESKTPPPVDTPATDAKPPELEEGKGVEGK